MAQDLASGTISGRDLYSDTDRIFEEETIPQNTSVASSVFDFGKTLDALEIVAEVGGTDIALADTTSMTITVAWDEDEAGSFSDSLVIYSVTASGATTLTSGDELARYVADHKKPVYYKVTVATTDAAATGTFDVNIASVRKG